MLRVAQTDWFDEIQDVEWDDGSQGSYPGKLVEKPEKGQVIDDDELSKILVDDVEDHRGAQPPQYGHLPEIPREQTEPSYLDEIPTSNEELGIPEGTKETVYDKDYLDERGVDYQLSGAQLSEDANAYSGTGEVISFNYTNRFGDYAGYRTVQPHILRWNANKNHWYLVSWDLDVNDVRAFIVGLIWPDGVRYEGASFEWNPAIKA